MPDTYLISRRLFIKYSSRLAVGTSATWFMGPGLALELDDLPDKLAADIQTLTLMVYELFPHKNLSSKIYLDTAKQIDQQAKQSPETEHLIQEGLAQLNVMAGNTLWSVLGRGQRQELLGKLESSPFFGYVRNKAIDMLYRHPHVWDLVGYGGSAIEHGGYLHRGFNDISWLPDPA